MRKYLLADRRLGAGRSRMSSRRHGAGETEPGKALDMVLLPKFLGILPFDQAHQGAHEAAEGAAELRSRCSSSGRRPRTASPARSSSSPTPPTQGVDGDHALQQLRRPDRAGGQGRAGEGHQGRDLGLADPDGRGRGRLRRPGRLHRDRQGHGRHGALDPRRGRRQVRDPLGLAGRGQPERLDRGDGGGARRIRNTPTSSCSTPSTATTSRRRATTRRKRWSTSTPT